MLVQNAIVPFDFASIPIDGVGKLFRGGMLEMHRLAREGAETRGDEQQPGEQLRAIGRRTNQAHVVARLKIGVDTLRSLFVAALSRPAAGSSRRSDVIVRQRALQCV